MGSLKVALVQIQQAEDQESCKEDVLQHAADVIMAAPSADIYLLPELAPTGYNQHVFDSLDVWAEAEGPDAATCQVLSTVAKERDAFICYGVPFCHPDGGYTIRQVVLDNSGAVIATYDKIHLCHFGDGRETNWFRPGEHLCFFDCRGFRLGVLICADMRYTELCRELAIGRGCDVLLHPTAFARDVTFASWPSFVECRALENQVYWAAVNYAGDHFGGSMWCPPWVDGVERSLAIEEAVVVHEATKEELASVRSSFPFLAARKDRSDYLSPQDR
ncbi:Omega-amidase NIT2 (Nitrilase homolog 2) [Durusdinium trenchii]|uniref:Omega-amidase NIT2 (Nitrilase homolog 2) n=1 Tax=Durusdinium trenchii TaxID=1381693 RepID=A0ABP0JS16_9DINO